MFKLTILAALALGTMTSAQTDKNIFSPAGNNSSALLAQKGNKGNKGESKHKEGSDKKSSHDGNQKAEQNKSYENKNSNTDHNKGDKSHQPNQNYSGKQNKGNHDKGNNNFKKNEKGHVAKGKKIHYEKGNPNHGYMYLNNHGNFSPNNYGYWRSKQAKNKHKQYHPYYEYQAIEGFNLIITRNGFLYTETEYKINLINVRLAERRKANLITVVQYDMYTSRILYLQQRRAALQINIEL